MEEDSNKDSLFLHKGLEIFQEKDTEQLLLHFYEFLKETFSLKGILLQRFLPHHNTMLNLLYIDEKGIHRLGSFFNFNSKQLLFIKAFALSGGVHSIPDSSLSNIAQINTSLLSDYITQEPCAHLSCVLQTSQGFAGLLRLIGNDIGCFDMEHQRRISMFSLPLGFVFNRLGKYEYIKEFMRKTIAENPPIQDDSKKSYMSIIGVEGGLKDVMQMVDKLAQTDASVLILGETGTGKDLIANSIQENSIRKFKPYITVNCGAIPDTLLDSILFGHEKGAFTGAYSSMPGKFELANGGTLFLDEIGELTPQAQVRLLRTLQNRVVERVGSTVPIFTDVRIIAATNRNLSAMVEKGLFREDLFHRINVFTINVPPLRERLEDILPLVDYFIAINTKRMGLPPVTGIHPKSTEELFHYHWPGNVRELENLVTRALVLSYDKTIKLDAYLPQDRSPYMQTQHKAPISELYNNQLLKQEVYAIIDRYMTEHENNNIRNETHGITKHPEHDKKVPFSNNAYSHETFKSLDEAMKEHILHALQITNGKIHGKNGAGELLGINPDTLRKRMIKLGIL